jgi:hypothetical protein
MSRGAVRGARYACRLVGWTATIVLIAGLPGCGSGGKKSTGATPTPTASATKTPGKAPVDRRPMAVQVRVADASHQAFAATAEAKPGDYVQLRAVVRTAADAPPRGLTILVARRARDDGLKVRARPTSGGKGSTATVRGASGKKVRLTDLRYSCFAPPAPTFCPLDSVRADAARYVVKAKVRRGRPVVLTFTARSG